MAYTLQAFIGDKRCLASIQIPGARVQPLDGKLVILPLVYSVAENLGIGFLPFTDQGLDAVPAVTRLGSELSKLGRVAYVEAEYFGGDGTQANYLFDQGAPVNEPTVSGQAINEALRFLGVIADGSNDEFDTVGLGRNRDTKDWLRRRRGP